MNNNFFLIISPRITKLCSRNWENRYFESYNLRHHPVIEVECIFAFKKELSWQGREGERGVHSLYLLEKPWADRFVNLLNAFVSLVWNQSLLLRLLCFLRHPLWIWKQSYIPTWIILSHQKHNEMVLLSKTYHRNCNPQKWCLGISAVSWSLLYQICKELSNFLYNWGNGHLEE